MIGSPDGFRRLAALPAVGPDGPKSYPGAYRPVAFGQKDRGKLRRYALRVGGAGDDEDRNVKQTAVWRMLLERIDAEAFDISLRIARDDRALAVIATRLVAKRRRSKGLAERSPFA